MVFKWKEMERNAQIRELLGLEPASLVVMKDRLRWFRHSEGDGDQVKLCMMMMEVDGIRQKGRPRQTW